MSGNENPFGAAFQVENADGDARVLLICDHASNALPAAYDNLGLPPAQLQRHIAYDIGALAVARLVAQKLHVPLVSAQFSRLLIDPNRGLDDPTLVMKLSDGALIPANQHIDRFNDYDEWQRRIDRFYLPYHNAISAALARAQQADIAPLIVSIHSFTPIWRGQARPWPIAVLWDKDDRFAAHMRSYMGQLPELALGDNEPYSGRLKNDTLYRHGTQNGLAHGLVELRQDEIDTADGQGFWAGHVAAMIEQALADPAIGAVKYFGSHTGLPAGPPGDKTL